MDERALFEAWARELEYDLRPMSELHPSGGDTYISPTTENVWSAWQAAWKAARSHQEWNPNEWSDERIDNMAELIIKGMPDGISGFCRTWGWRQFARALIEICKLPPPAQPVEAPQGGGNV